MSTMFDGLKDDDRITNNTTTENNSTLRGPHTIAMAVAASLELLDHPLVYELKLEPDDPDSAARWNSTYLTKEVLKALYINFNVLYFEANEPYLRKLEESVGNSDDFAANLIKINNQLLKQGINIFPPYQISTGSSTDSEAEAEEEETSTDSVSTDDNSRSKPEGSLPDGDDAVSDSDAEAKRIEAEDPGGIESANENELENNEAMPTKQLSEDVKKIPHFSDADIADMAKFQKVFERRLQWRVKHDVGNERAEEFRTIYNLIVNDAKRIGFNKTLRIIYELTMVKGIYIYALFDYFILIILAYTTPYFFEFFFCFFHGEERFMSDIAFLPNYDEQIQPHIHAAFHNKTSDHTTPAAEIDYFQLLEDYFLKEIPIQTYGLNIDDFKKYRMEFETEGLNTMAHRFLSYIKTEKKDGNVFQYCQDQTLLMFHLVYLSRSPWLYLGRTSSVYFLKAEMEHVACIFDRDTFEQYCNDVELKCDMRKMILR